MPEQTDRNQGGEQTFAETYLSGFVDENQHVKIWVEDGEVIIDKPWGSDGVRIVCGTEDHDFIRDMNNVRLDVQFDALFHLDTNEIELIYAYLNPEGDDTKDIVDRKFTVMLGGIEYRCEFREPSDRLLAIANKIRRSPSESAYETVPQIDQFSDGQKLEELPPRVRSYFDGKVPRSLFVAPSASLCEVDFPAAARHINLLTSYYDRMAPFIIVRQDTRLTEEDNPTKRRYVETPFPGAMVARETDEFMLTLLEVANSSPPRMAYLYCYQIFEYAGFYYIDDKVRTELRRMLRDPALINCDSDKVADMFSLFSDLRHSDDQKMKSVISECCSPRVCWAEIEHDREFFEEEQSYTGGFVSQGLISSETTEKSWVATWMPNTYDHLTRIRNCLVHARERRESRVILPTHSNNLKIMRCLPLIRRMAEQVALKSDMGVV